MITSRIYLYNKKELWPKFSQPHYTSNTAASILSELFMWTLSIDFPGSKWTSPCCPELPDLNLPVLYLYWYTANQFILNGSEHARNVPVLAV